MKKTLKLLAALALIIFVGCTKELVDDSANQAGPEVENPEVKPDEEPVANTTVTIDLPSDEAAVAPSGISVKTTLGALEDGVRKIYWCEDDKISINGNASTLMTNLSDDKRSATFEFADAVLEYPYSVLYPAEMYKDAQTITLLAVQPSADDSFADDAAPMAAYQASAGKITLKHLVGVVRLQIKLPAESTHGQHTLNRVEFSGNNSEQVSGDFTINYKDATITSASTAEADQKVVAMVEKTLSSESNTDVFIVVPAMQYAQGFTVRLVDGAGHYMDISTEDITIAAGEVKRMPVVEFAPKGTLADVEITSAADLVAFAKAYNAGEYSQSEDLKVVVKNDIVFDDETNAAWVPIGKSGSYFKGTFDGGEFSIKNWVTSSPLFFGIDPEGTVKDLTVDSSCTLTANYAAEDNYFGAFTRYNKGLLSSCHNHADIEVTGIWGKQSFVAGLVGYLDTAGAKIENCSMTGDITADENFKVTGNIYYAGITGLVNTDCEVINSDFKGNLTFAGNTSNYAYIGGIAGRVVGVVSQCATAEGKSIRGGHESNTAQYIYWGGIAGSVKGHILDCENNASIELKFQRTNSTKSVRLGGVVGYFESPATIENCINKGAVYSASAYADIYVGGVVAQANNGTTINNCHNVNGEIVAKSSETGSYGAKNLYMGGVIGLCASSQVTSISNSGRVEVKHFEDNADSKVNVGGCIGELQATLNGQNTTITNSGTVISTDAIANRASLAIGGVVGSLNKADAILSYVSNVGNVEDAVTVAHTNSFSGGVVGLVRAAATIQNVTNGVFGDLTKGNVSFTQAPKLAHLNVALGGVVGGVSALSGNDFAVAVVNSTNYGKVERTSASTNNRGMVCGGIVGVLKGTGSYVKSCTNYGSVEIASPSLKNYDSDFDLFNTSKSSITAGGIVGYGLGTESNLVKIEKCTNAAYCYSGGGYVGGIAGYVRYAEISECHHSTCEVYGDQQYVRVGGITGFLNASSVTLCTVVANVKGKGPARMGGISGGMNKTASIISSTVQGTLTAEDANTGVGAIVYLSESGATVSNCQAKGTIVKVSTSASITIEDFVGDKITTATDSSILE